MSYLTFQPLRILITLMCIWMNNLALIFRDTIKANAISNLLSEAIWWPHWLLILLLLPQTPPWRTFHAILIMALGGKSANEYIGQVRFLHCKSLTLDEYRATFRKPRPFRRHLHSSFANSASTSANTYHINTAPYITIAKSKRSSIAYQKAFYTLIIS